MPGPAAASVRDPGWARHGEGLTHPHGSREPSRMDAKRLRRRGRAGRLSAALPTLSSVLRREEERLPQGLGLPTQPSPRVRAGGLSPPSRERCPPAQGAWRGQHLPGGPAPIHAAVAQGLEATCLPAW